MKVVCINKGNQSNDKPTVKVGNPYTVTDWCYGWEMMHPKTSDIFYQLAEMPEDQRFCSNLFAEISDISESEVEKCESIEAVLS